MTLEEILAGYERLWAEADRAGEPQWRGGRADSAGICAALIANRESRTFSVSAFRDVEGGWVCECGWVIAEHSLWRSIVHLNDPPHAWSWSDLAKNFREAYRLGVERWAQRIAA